MKIIVCLDDGNGMMFNHRRQSRDRALIDDVIETVGEGRLLIDAYSASLFAGKSLTPEISENMPADAKCGDFCFVECGSVAAFGDATEELIIYRWNREYPRDVVFDLDIERSGLKLFQATEFVGYSHEKITKEIYVK